MYFIKNSNILIRLWLISLISLLLSCSANDVSISGEKEDSEKNESGDFLEFRISLPVMDTRSGEDFEKYEDEIDLSGVQILFFKADDNSFFKQFGADKLQYLPLGSTEDSKKNWYVRIQVDDEDFADTIRNYNFKIAILANWPSEVTFNPGDSLDKLHHLESDEISTETYKYLTNNTGKLGLNSNWVNFKEKNEEYDYQIDEGIMLSEAKLIPMYGIQTFGMLKDVWIKGTTFNLSNFNQMNPHGYQPRDICLLRSVAKVELFVASDLKAHHLFLRNMNSSASCEPMDISTPTDEIWANVGSYKEKGSDPALTEWGKIMNRKPFYSTEGTADTYKTDLSWYFGSWFNTENLSQFPQIINPRIMRSDFAEFIKVGNKEHKEDDYDRYLLYVPEKFVDDPDEANNPASDPKVCHIEFRIEGDPINNLNDDNCYRVYFIEGGVDKEFVEKVGYPTFGKDEDGNDLKWENLYEQNPTYLAKHWPIIRNHHYEFTVDGGGGKIYATLKVLPWKVKDIEVNW